jgi:DNA (cytosine-5-)-methyltransferase
MAKKYYRLIDLFAGCGGMSLGFQNAGFEVIAAYDFWQAAIDIYKENFQHPIYKVDLSRKDISEELAAANPDIIIGGPPCQDFSIAGKREFEGKRANLTLIYSNIISAVKPRWFVMENVYNIEKSPVFAQAVSNFRKAGYGITKRIWDASYMGVPQMRKRYFVIGKLGAPDDFLMRSLLKGLTEKRMTVRQYLKDSPLDTEYYYMHPRSYARRAIFSIDEPSATIRGINRPIPSGYQFHPADKTRDINLVRSLTSKERSYLQTFPAEFIFVGAKTDIEQAIGNAVPIKMAEYIAKRIIRYMMDYD